MLNEYDNLQYQTNLNISRTKRKMEKPILKVPLRSNFWYSTFLHILVKSTTLLYWQISNPYEHGIDGFYTGLYGRH